MVAQNQESFGLQIRIELLYLNHLMNSVKSRAFLFIAFVNFPMLISADAGFKYSELSKIVKNVIGNDETPSVLSIKTCWSKSDEFNFVKNSAFPIHIIDPSSTISLSFEDDVVGTQWFFADISCERNADFLLSVNARYFAHPYRWVIAGAGDDSIANLTLLPDSNIVFADRNAELQQYDLKQGC